MPRCSTVHLNVECGTLNEAMPFTPLRSRAAGSSFASGILPHFTHIFLPSLDAAHRERRGRRRPQLRRVSGGSRRLMSAALPAPDARGRDRSPCFFDHVRGTSAGAHLGCCGAHWKMKWKFEEALCVSTVWF